MAEITNFLSKIDLNSLITIFDIQIALAIVVISILLKGVFARTVIRITYAFTKNKKSPKESEMYGPIKKMFVLATIYIALAIIPKSKQVSYYINKGFEIIIIIFITKLIASLINKDSKHFKKILNKSENDNVNDFVCKICRGFVWVISIFIILAELDIKLSGLITGLGVASAVVALAAQELVKNLLSGVSILTDKPFEIGDWIEVGTYAGTVVDITFRSTRIRAINNTIVTIPNSVITSEYVINWNRLKSRRLDIILNLHLDTPSEKIKKILKQIKLVLANNSHVIEDTIQVNFDEIANSSSNIKMFMYIDETDYIKFLNIKEEVLCSLLELIEKENIYLAYPTQTVYLKNSEGDIK